MKVFINNKEDKTKRELVEVVVVRETAANLFVKLPDGNIIKRKKARDLVQETPTT